ncbi:MAG: dethiobiotin synthase [Rhodocyclaceae bacterium]
MNIALKRPDAAGVAGLRGVFVTGTDTEIGKTRIAAGLLHALAAHGLRTAGLKPVAAGTDYVDGRVCNEDVALLRSASSVAVGEAEVGPCQLAAACAPHIAAELEGRRIELADLTDAAHRLAQKADWLVVEGVGGFRVPFDDHHDSADLAVALGLPVVMVVGMRLGCLNHALLTADAIRARGLTLAGWVGNTVDPGMPHRDRNLHTLRAHLAPAPCLGVVPWLAQPSPAAVASCFARDHLVALVGDVRTVQPD